MIRSWEDIPGYFDFQDIYVQAVMEANHGDILVEVGGFLGKSAAYLAERVKASGKDLQVICVDPWSDVDYAEWWATCNNPYPYPKPGLELQGKSLWDAMIYCTSEAGALDYIEPMRMKSHDAAPCFSDKSVSMVFLDGDHEYGAVAKDIALWREKVKPGGILAGHDYTDEHPGVVRAVDEAFSGRIERRAPSWLVRM